MSTHPVEPEPAPAPEHHEPVPANPTHLPVEPEFGPALAPARPEEPGTPSPKI